MRYLILLIISIVIYSCASDEDPIDPYLGLEYVPLEVGTEHIYQMDSIIFGIDSESPSGEVYDRDTSSYFLRERTEEIVELDSRTFFAVDQYKSDSIEGPWTFYKRIYDIIEGNSYRRVDDNLEIVQFAFPPFLGKSWAPASIINQSVGVPIGTNFVRVYDKWDDAYIIDFYTEYEFGSDLVDSVYHVELVNFESTIEYRFEEHFYANNIGMIRRNLAIMDTQTYPNSILSREIFESVAEAGYILNQTLIIP